MIPIYISIQANLDLAHKACECKKRMSNRVSVKESLKCKSKGAAPNTREGLWERTACKRREEELERVY